MSTRADEQAIQELYVAWRRASLAEDVPTLLNLIADDAIFLVPGQPPMRGKQQFAQMFEAVRGKFHIEAKSEFDEIAVHGDWAYAVCRLAVEMTPKSGGASVLNSGHTLTILHKRQDGSWVVARDANLLVPEPIDAHG